MINDATDRHSEITRDFADIYQQAATFINEVNDILAGENVFLTLNLPQIRSNRRPTGIQSETSAKHFEISCHNVILDTVVESINRRFADHKDLYKKIACFDPNRLDEVKAHPERIKLTTVPEALPEVGSVSLRKELISSASNCAQLKQGLLPLDADGNSDETDDDNMDGEKMIIHPRRNWGK